MEKNLIFAAIVACGLSVSAAQASTIEIQTGYSTDGTQSSADAYKSVVDAAVAIPTAGYGATPVSIYDGISNHGLFAGGAGGSIAFESTVNFGVSAANAGSWEIRSGVDFGNGGAIYVDGQRIDFKSHDMWWNGSYGDSTQIFDITLNLSAGNHTVKLYGLEDCCDGGQQAQFRIGNSTTFTTFSNQDGLIPAVPEPETYAMMMAGLGLVGFVARRRKGTQA